MKIEIENRKIEIAFENYNKHLKNYNIKEVDYQYFINELLYLWFNRNNIEKTDAHWKVAGIN